MMIFLPLVLFALSLTFSVPAASFIGLSLFGVILVIAVAVVVIAASLNRSVGEHTPTKSAMIRRGISILSAVLILLSLSLPFVSLSADADYAWSETDETIREDYSIGFFYNMSLTEEERREYMDIDSYENLWDMRERVDRWVTSKEKPTISFESFAVDAFFIGDGWSFADTAALVPLIFSLAGLFAAALLIVTLFSIMRGKNPPLVLVLVLKVLILLLVIAGLILVQYTAFLTSTNIRVTINPRNYYDIITSLGIGPILAAIAAIILAAVPLGEKKRGRDESVESPVEVAEAA